MKSEYIINRQGRDMVLYPGLLNETHAQGLKRVTTKLVQIPGPENGHVAICFAEVETDRGFFTGIGDASPENVSRNIVPHIIRMAETRAKARAFRDALNVGELLADDPEETDDPAATYEALRVRAAAAGIPAKPLPDDADAAKARVWSQLLADKLAKADSGRTV